MKIFSNSLITAALLLQGTVAVISNGGQAPLKTDSSSSQVTSALSSNETTELLALHKKLVNIESISGNEHDVGIFLADYLRERGWTVKLQHIPPLETNPRDSRRYNVYAHHGKHSDTDTVLLTSHIDTVPPFYPYHLDMDTGEISGRGSVDAKGSVATQITAAEALLASDATAEGDVELLFVCGEEVNGGGMKAANELALGWKAGIFGEPTELKLAEGHKGILSFSMTATGRAAHSGYPWLGIDANSKLIRAMAALDAADLGYSDKYGNTTLNIGRIAGGVAGNVVSDHARADVQTRLAVGPPGDIEAKIRKLVEHTGVELNFNSGYGPIDCDADVPGFDTITVNYGTDVPHLKPDRLSKRYLYGPGSIFVAHGDHEHLNVRDLLTAVDGYKKLVKHALAL